MQASTNPRCQARAPDFLGPTLGHYPSPVRRLAELERPGTELWLKDDGVLNPRYGGNKVRKLELLLEQAKAQGARRIVTAGAAGSHHALATALFGTEHGFEVAAALCPQAWTAHAEQTLTAAVAAGLDVRVARSMAGIPLVVARALEPGDFFIPPGGASIVGTLGYLRAVEELVAQIDRGDLPEPDIIVVPAGSGSTVAGISAGVLREGLRSQVLGVSVAAPARALLPWVVFLAERALARAAKHGGSGAVRRLGAILHLDDGFRGAGYGVPSDTGSVAGTLARREGMWLDPTYTEKAFAGALGLIGLSPFEKPRTVGATVNKSGRPFRVLYWHTLSAAPLGGLVERAGPRLSLCDRLLPHT